MLEAKLPKKRKHDEVTQCCYIHVQLFACSLSKTLKFCTALVISALPQLCQDMRALHTPSSHYCC